MAWDVYATPIADRQIAGLRGRRRKAYEEFEQVLSHQGCAAMGYRLTGDAPLSLLCVKHLSGTDRAVVAFVDGDAWVLLVGPHVDGEEAADVYATLYDLLGVERPTQARTKPPCCAGDGQPPTLLDEQLDLFQHRRR